jgi:hypothetical protein
MKNASRDKMELFLQNLWRNWKNSEMETSGSGQLYLHTNTLTEFKAKIFHQMMIVTE